MKIVQSIVNKLKNDFTEYYPVSFEYDIKLPDYYELKLDLGYELNQQSFTDMLLPPNMVNFTNIKYDMLTMDLNNMEIDFRNYEYQKVIWVSFPFLESWQLSYDYTFDWTIWPYPETGNANITVKDVGLDLAFSLTKDKEGRIKPAIHYINVSLGKILLDMDDKIVKWFSQQILNIGKVLIQNSINLIGWPMI